MNTDTVKNNNKIVKFPIKREWEKELTLNSIGGVANTIDNYCIILKCHEHFKDNIKLNQLSNTEEFKGKSIQQIDYDNIQRIVEKEYGIYNEKKLASAIRSVAAENPYHPIRKYLESLKWDGIKRADTALADYFGADYSEYNSMCLRLVLFGAIERVFNPRL
jgi:predicted P-loop ATPase